MDVINQVHCLDVLEGFRLLKDQSIDVVVTSPPYAEQRKNQYQSIHEGDYPEWTVKWMNEVKRVLKPAGSVFINIRPHLKKGQISDYTLKMRLALRESGWKECEELIWIKPDSPPLGSTKRPRRAWESIHWFSLTHDPFCDPKANGVLSNRIGFENSKFEHGGKSHIHAGQNRAKQGMSRSRDYVEVGTGKIEKGIKHPAMYPIEIPDYLIKLACPSSGVVCDPFAGSGTTLLSAKQLNMDYVGFEINKDYANIANERIDSYLPLLV